MKALKIAFLLCCLIVSSCKDPFTPEVSKNYKDLLVVEGFINIGGTTQIKVSRSIDLQDSRSTDPETNATIAIEGEDGSLVTGKSTEKGECFLMTQNLVLGKKYKARIILASGKVYETGYLATKATPEIDSISYAIADKGFQIFANTHDPANDTRFYTWDYEETWEVGVPFVSTMEFKNSQVVARDPSVNIQRCWTSSKSSNILLGSTARLSEDKLTLVPIVYIPGNSVKVAKLYSILVRQYGLTKDAYEFMERMKKNTEQIGGIFDVQPSELKGNLVCISDPAEKVLGWISAGTIVEKRIFISYQDKPSSGVNWVYRENCNASVIDKDSLVYYIRSNKFIVNEMYAETYPGGPLMYKYTMSTEECIDCRLQGSNLKPAFWPN
ncbi:hypothetical protein D3C87_303780 [compost metagenome]